MSKLCGEECAHIFAGSEVPHDWRDNWLPCWDNMPADGWFSVVFRFGRAPRATSGGKPHDPQHICHRIAGPRLARQTGSHLTRARAYSHSHCETCSV